MPSTMAGRYHSKLIRNNMRWLGIIGCLVIGCSVQAQQKIATVSVPKALRAYIDRPGDVYVQTQANKILKFDTLGKAAGEIPFGHTLTVFDPRDGARMFAYIADTQTASFFSEETKREIKIEEHYAVEPLLVTSAGDHQLWIVDKADWSVKRIDPRNTQVLAEAPVDQNQFTGHPVFTGIREYQNFLFLIEQHTGILVFNSLGKQIKTLSGAGIEYLNFLGEELYYKKGNTLFFYNLFDGSTREQAVDAQALYVLLTDVRRYVVYEKRVEVFKQ